MKEQDDITITENIIIKSGDKPSVDTAQLYKWQNKLLPFLIGVPSILAIIFIVLTTRQINEFNAVVNEKKDANFIGTIIPSPANLAYANNTDYIKWTTLVHMEEESLDRRYKQAGFLLMSRVLTKYLGFFTGMILAIIGAAFIIGKLSEDVTTMEGTVSEKIKFKVASASPGILFGILGTALMLTAILAQSEINVQDQPLYLNANTIQVYGGSKQAKPAHPIDLNRLDSTDKVHQ